MEAHYVQNETDEKREGFKAQELVQELGQPRTSGARSEGRRAQEEAAPVELYCLAPDELFDDGPGDDVLHEVLSQGFLPCWRNPGWVGPWCRPCQWGSVVDLPGKQSRHRRAQKSAEISDSLDEPAEEEPHTGLSPRDRQHERIRRLRKENR